MDYPLMKQYHGAYFSIYERAQDEKFCCSFLARLISDCKYYLGYGNKDSGTLWVHDPAKHIALLKEVYNFTLVNFGSPEWVDINEINCFIEQMEN